VQDDDIRELERHLGEGDASARPRLAAVLLRAGLSLAPLMGDTGIEDPGLATAARELDATSYERLVADLGQLDAAGIVEGLGGGAKYAARLAVYVSASGESRALNARREDKRIWLALEPESADEKASKDFTTWDQSAGGRASWRLDHRRARRRLPFVFTVQNLGLGIRALFAAVDPAVPATLRAVVRRTEDRAANSVITTTTWAHEALRAELVEATDYEHPPMESADRSAWASVSGLPGETRISLAVENATTITHFELRGRRPEADLVLAGWGKGLLALADANVWVQELDLPLDAWVARARGLDLGDFVFDERPWWLVEPEMIVAKKEVPHFAFAFGGGFERKAATAGVWIDPIGPVPALRHAVSFVARHAASITPVDAVPDLGALVESLLGAPLPAEPEAVATPWPTHRTRRFRVGSWVIRDWRETFGDATTTRLRFQEESGGPWALFAKLDTQKNGLGRGSFNLLGAPDATRLPEERVHAWLVAKGWSMEAKHRHVRGPLP
jgi:hypothetical protein